MKKTLLNKELAIEKVTDTLTTDIYKKLHHKALLPLLSCPGCKVRSAGQLRKCYTNLTAHISTFSQIWRPTEDTTLLF